MTDYNALRNAVIGAIPEDRYLWRINWLKSVLDAVESGELAITDKCGDPETMHDALSECRDMVKAVNDTLADWPQISEDAAEDNELNTDVALGRISRPDVISGV